MLTVVHVHGTGVRDPRYSADFERFSLRVRAMRPDVRTVPCNWGADHGSTLLANGVTIPDARGSDRGVGDGFTPEDRDIALWGILEVDPLFELGLLDAVSVEAEGRGDSAPNRELPTETLAALIRRLPETLAAEVDKLGLAPVFDDAVQTVLDSDEAQDILDRADELGAEVRAAMARAIVATAMLLADDEPAAAELDGAKRDALVVSLRRSIGDTDRGIGADAGKFAVRLAIKLGATKPIERHRAAITRATTAAAGDILLYLARGSDIRSYIAETVAAVAGPIVIVAHSLGGIAAVDLLVEQDLPQVKALVTVGSQAPLLYEIGALPSLKYDDPLPAHFPEKWTNFYDLRDLLAFIGGPVFGSKCSDHPIDNKSPFPRSHSAYFANDLFYQALDTVLRDIN